MNFYAVRTTGIYCRTACRARPPKPENVVYFETGAEAVAAGFRPCKRCKPDQPVEEHAAIVAEICRWIASLDRMPALAEMAARAGLSPFHFHRVFKQATGLTPRQYAAARRAERMRSSLGTARSVTDAVYDAGYDSNGTFYAEADAALGMKPSTYRAGGADEAIEFAVRACSLGTILVARSSRGICSILLGDNPEALESDLRTRFPRAAISEGSASFEQDLAQVIASVEMPSRGLALPLDVRGTAFQRRVWQELQKIPAGSTASYSEIAARIGAAKSVRAVARACASNVLAVAIPCHRVVGRDGSLTGYRWGVERKRAILGRERSGGA